MNKFEKIRTEIKKLSEEQKKLKPQRKESFTGNRTVTSENASSTVRFNKYELRHLFEAYAILKGVKRNEIKKPDGYRGYLIDDSKILELLKIYKVI